MSINLSGVSAEVRSYIFDLEAKVEASYAGKHVLLVAVIAFLVGAVLF